MLGNTHALQRYAQRLQTYLAAIHAHEPREHLDILRRDLRIDRLLEDLPPLIEGPWKALNARATSSTA